MNDLWELFETVVCEPMVRRFILFVKALSLMLRVTWDETKRFNASTLVNHTLSLFETICEDARERCYIFPSTSPFPTGIFLPKSLPPSPVFPTSFFSSSLFLSRSYPTRFFPPWFFPNSFSSPHWYFPTPLLGNFPPFCFHQGFFFIKKN